MIRLNPTAQDRVIDLGGGVELTCAPLTSAVFAAARNDPAVIAMVTAGAGPEEATLATIKAVARRVIKDWNGVGDAEGNPVDPDPKRIDQLLDIWPLYDAFNAKFCGPALILVTEGNGFAPLLNGISAGALDTAASVTSPAPTAPTR